MKPQLGYWRWKVYRWNEHANPFRDRYELALQWLRQHQDDRIFLEELRAVLVRCGLFHLPSTDPRRILEEAARRLSSGELHLCGEFADPFHTEGHVPAPAAEPIPARASPVSASAAAPAATPAATTAPATAAASTTAASTAASTAPADTSAAETAAASLAPTTDAAATAQALKDAAQTGVPFCAECEKAKQAAQQAATSGATSAASVS